MVSIEFGRSPLLDKLYIDALPVPRARPDSDIVGKERGLKKKMIEEPMRFVLVIRNSILVKKGYKAEKRGTLARQNRYLFIACSNTKRKEKRVESRRWFEARGRSNLLKKKRKEKGNNWCGDKKFLGRILTATLTRETIGPARPYTRKYPRCWQKKKKKWI